MQNLGTLGGTDSYARDINNSSQIVGEASIGSGGYHAFLWQFGSGMQDLNDLIPPSSGWTLEYGTVINDHEEIAGYGHNSSGQVHAFLLTPIPEPSTLALLGIGIGAISLVVCGWRRRRWSR